MWSRGVVVLGWPSVLPPLMRMVVAYKVSKSHRCTILQQRNRKGKFKYISIFFLQERYINRVHMSKNGYTCDYDDTFLKVCKFSSEFLRRQVLVFLYVVGPATLYKRKYNPIGTMPANVLQLLGPL
jgi:hypothetical protein